MTSTLPAGPSLAHSEAGSGPALVLLHAFPQTRAMWKRQIESLSADFRVLCPDLPGFGQSRPASTCSIDGMADAVAAWLKCLQVERAIIGGVSMGGYVALAMARRHPQVLAGLILASTRADADSAQAREGRAEMIEFARQNDARAVFEKMAPKLFAPQILASRPRIVRDAASIAEPISQQSILETIAALRDRPDARPGLAAVGVLTLILVGSEDAVSPVESAHEMADSIPNSTLQVLEGAGHFAHAESALEWSEAVRGWALSKGLAR